MRLFKGEGCWHTELDQLTFIICRDGFSCCSVFRASAEFRVTFEVFSKLFDTLINMTMMPKERKDKEIIIINTWRICAQVLCKM